EESLDALEKDTVFADMLGEEFVKAYTTMRWNEVTRFRSHITDWEKQEYLEIY
ncbi:MAG: glutamine synthetase, partial [Chloroflexi bacterium]|nr:glutamine synthetase [Chloroflexota bacterium]